ncbi:hypothetical protein MKW92_027223, partial [Papaver armeniacum]
TSPPSPLPSPVQLQLPRPPRPTVQPILSPPPPGLTSRFEVRLWSRGTPPRGRTGRFEDNPRLPPPSPLQGPPSGRP